LRKTPLRSLLGGLAATLVLSSCSSGGVADLERQAEDVADASAPAIERYAALGDSFTAGPLVPTTDLAGGCFRSDSNYPSLLAERLDIDELVDVSCSGAQTADLVHRQDTVRGASVPPQLRAVTPDTDLVTLGIGGNDFGLFHSLVAGCTQVADADPDGAPCADRLRDRGADLVDRTDRIGVRVEQAVRRIQEKAPEARVVLVGYLRLAPSSGRCEELPFAEGDYEYGQQVTRALNAALERAARRTGAAFIDMYAASEGHDICSEDPWVNGAQTVEGEALAFHPFAEGMEAVAERLTEALDR